MGCVLPSEQRSGLDISLKVKRVDAGLKTLALWGRIFTTTGKDYVLAEGCVSAKRVARKLVLDTKYYFSQDGVKWLDLEAPVTEDRYTLCKGCKGPFTGDPSNKFFVIPEPPAPSEFDESPSNPDAPQKMDYELVYTAKKQLPFALNLMLAKAYFDVQGDRPFKEDLSVSYVIEPALKGDKSGSSPNEESSTDEDDAGGLTETESTEAATEGEDSEVSPGEPEEAKVIDDEEVAEGGEEGEGVEGEDVPKGTEVPELERLAGLMRWVDEECGVVPDNALVLTPSNILVKNTAFTGPKFMNELDSYCHLFTGYHAAPLSKDLPGSWSIHTIPLQRDVIVRSLAWPGYFMYYSSTNHDYGSVYFGHGEKNKDIAFGVP